MRFWILVITFTLLLRSSMSALLVQALSKDAGLLLRLILASDQNINGEEYGGKIDTNTLIEYQSKGFTKFINMTRSLAEKRFKGNIPAKLQEKIDQAQESVDKFRRSLRQPPDPEKTDSKKLTRLSKIVTKIKKKGRRREVISRNIPDFASDY